MNFPTRESKLGEALQSIGRMLPELMRQKQLDKNSDEERRRQRLLDDISMRSATMSFNKQMDEQDRTGKVRGEVDRIVSEITNPMLQIKMNGKTGEELPVPKEFEGGEYSERSGLTPEDLSQGAKMRNISDDERSLYDRFVESPEVMRNAELPVTKEIMNTLEAKEKIRANKEASNSRRAPGVWGAKTALYENDPTAKTKLVNQIEYLYSLPEGNPAKLSKDQYDRFMRTADVDPATTDMELGKYIQDPAVSEAILRKTMDEKATGAYKNAYGSAQGSLQAGLDAPTKQGASGIDPYTGKPITEGQNTAAKWAVGMGRAIENIEELTKSGFNEADILNQVMVLFNKKDKLSRADILNAARTPEQRRYLNAAIDFMVPHLRDQSGAAINRDEYTTELQQYFPTVVDDKEMIQQKRANRIEEFATRKALAGGAYDRAWNEVQSQQQGGFTRKPTSDKTDLPDKKEVIKYVRDPKTGKPVRAR